MKNIQKFNLDNEKDIHDYFLENGYVVINNAIPHQTIDEFIYEYEHIKKSPFFIYYSQSIHISTRPRLNKYSYIEESMQNASRLKFFNNFSSKIQSCLYGKNVSKALSCVTGKEKHISWQNMFFDKSTGTIEHQDSWYLDTQPPGGLVGVWYALENIHQNSGPFFVFPGSHKMGLIEREKFPDHNDFVTEIQRISNQLNIPKKAMCLNKGDILLWHPFLIHGAFQCSDESKSRKSFTSHFYPQGLTAKDTEKKKLLSIYNHNKPKPTANKDICLAYRYHDYFYNVLVCFLYIKNKLKTNKLFSMRREDYS